MTSRRIAVTVTFATDDLGVQVAAKALARLLDCPHELVALSWTDYEVEEDDNRDD